MNKFVCEECGRFCYSAATASTMTDDRCPHSGCNGHVISENEGGNMKYTIKKIVALNFRDPTELGTGIEPIGGTVYGYFDTMREAVMETEGCCDCYREQEFTEEGWREAERNLNSGHEWPEKVEYDSWVNDIQFKHNMAYHAKASGVYKRIQGMKNIKDAAINDVEAAKEDLIDDARRNIANVDYISRVSDRLDTLRSRSARLDRYIRLIDKSIAEWEKLTGNKWGRF